MQRRDEYDRRQDYDYSERVEDDVARWGGRQEERIEDFPENAARWTGEKVSTSSDLRSLRNAKY